MDNEKSVAIPTGGAVAAPGKPMLKKGLEEGIDRDEIIIPRAKLLQALSPEVVEDQKNRTGKHYPGLIINSLTKEILPSEFIPILKFTEWIRFNPRKKDDPNFDPAFDPGALIYRTRNAEDPRLVKDAAFGPNGEKPAATRFMNFLAYFPGCPMPVVASFCNTSFKTGKQLLNMLQYSSGEIYSRRYTLSAKQDKNDLGEFFVFNVALAGEAKEEEFKTAESWYANLKAVLGKIETHQESERWAGDDAVTEKAPY